MYPLRKQIEDQREKSGSSGGWGGYLFAAVLGAGVGYFASKSSQSNINYDMNCPITHEIMQEPYFLTTCGHSFDKNSITQWVKKKGQCPLCKTPANQSQIKVNYKLKDIIQCYHQNKK